MTYLEKPGTPQEALAHYGVKGMKWGVRKDERGAIRRGATKYNTSRKAGAQVISEGEKKLIFLPQQNRRDAALRTQARLITKAVSINRQPEFKGKDLKTNPVLRETYYKKMAEAAKTIYAEELNISRVEAWGSALSVETSAMTQQMRINAVRDRIKHSSDDVTLLVMDFNTDELGHIVDIKIPDEYLKHFEDNELTVMHYGVKGMKWGVRKDKPTNADIYDARIRVAKKNIQYHEDRTRIERSDASRSEKREQIKDLKVSALADPDRQTALRMRTGEKAALAALTVMAAPVAASVVAQRALVKRQLTKAAEEKAKKN